MIPTIKQVCSICKITYSDENDIININKEYKCNNCQQQLINFVTFDLATQLDIILNNEINLNQIKNSNHRSRNKTDKQLRDATDGAIYQQFIRQCDPKKLVVSLNLNSDGAPIDKVGKFTMWPVIASVVELEHATREQFKNMIILGT